MTKYSFDSVIFDLDGVITNTASVHGYAWKAAFDDYMRIREKRDGEPFREFTHENDYLPYVDGKPRYEGVKSFLESRGIDIPFGDTSDTPGKETVCGIGNSKNEMFSKILKEKGAEVFQSSVDLIRSLKAAGIRVGVASSSKNCKPILESAGLADLFETRVDGVVSAELKLKGKPEPDIFIKAAENIGSAPLRSVVVEDATSGVQAGRNGGFQLVLGIARENNETDLMENGADVVVNDLAAVNIDFIEEWFSRRPRPLLEFWDKPAQPEDKGNISFNPRFLRSVKDSLFTGKRLIFFLDYDGTLTPIVDRPNMAIMSDEMRDVVTRLSKKHTVAIVSGRMREDVQNLVHIPDLFYVGSHGFDILGPGGFSMIQPKAQEVIPVVSKVIERLEGELKDIPGALVEKKRFSVAAHYRLVDEAKYLPKIKRLVEDLVKENASLRLMSGKKVFEILPNIEWNKGMAIRWIMKTMGLKWDDASVVYIGDDVTDEFAMRIIRTRGTNMLVAEGSPPSSADFQLSVPEDVKDLFEKVIETS